MPKLTRIYTRTGDDGTTGLVGGQRIKKDSLRLETYGTIDELSSSIGVARTALADISRNACDPAANKRIDELDRWLAWTQDMLFNLGSELATLPEDRRTQGAFDGASAARALERAGDGAQAHVPPLANFIHPGGSYPGAFLHVARTVCRRAERLLVKLGSEERNPSEPERYVNRLSDALFVWSRWINHTLHRPEHLWNPSAAPPPEGSEEIRGPA
jgi:cob(I)alamin adenosyltransferase